MPYWIEEWSNSYAKIWVKVPYIPANGETEIKMYYGNPNAVSKSNVTQTFLDIIENVVLALPMDEGKGTIVHDYSGNDNHGYTYGATWVKGKFGNALRFDRGLHSICTNTRFRFSGCSQR